MEKIPDRDKKTLRDSQKKWIAFKDTEFNFMFIHIQREGGSLAKIITAQRKAAFVRNRFIELEAYVFIFDLPP
jgi:uncharacterized protein YecT (DUF1311 family)